jgi:beta-ribofuranosylaminobenzene 5'-phosphate synthase
MDEASQAVTICTGSRLHFGLFDTRTPFGGVGVMIDQPQTSVRISRSAEFQVIAADQDRVVAIARRFNAAYLTDRIGNALPPCKIEIRSTADSHFGLGSGTQLALATAAGLADFFAVNAARTDLIDHIAQRGRRSAVGSLGFFTGGLIIEDGSSEDYDRHDWWRQTALPPQWRFLLVRPPATMTPISGEVERNAFAALPAASESLQTELTGLGEAIFDAATQGDFSRFAEQVTRFNRQSGALFADQQGGCYNGPAVTELIEHVAAIGATGYGQSSWGPTVFVVAESQQHADHLKSQLSPNFSVKITQTKATAASSEKTM